MATERTVAHNTWVAHLARNMTERGLQQQALDAVAKLGRGQLLAYHTFDSRRSVAGFPDLVIVGPRGVLYRELKTAKGRVAPAQHRWLEALTAAGQDAAVWRPVDWLEGRITAEIRALL